ncbi:MAG TPA: glycoside hydrolase family 6 protein [Marinagarivorans sp.]
MKQGLSQWSLTLFKGVGASALAMAIAGCVGTPGTSSSSEQQTQSSTPAISSSSVTNTSSSAAPVPSSSSVPASSSEPTQSSSAPNTGGDQAAVDIVDPAKYDGDIPLTQAAVGTPGAPLQTDGNPFADSYFYLSPDIKTMMDYSLELVENNEEPLLGNLSAAEREEWVNKIKYVQRQPSAVWMDSIATIAGDPEAGRRSLVGHLEAAVAQQEFFAQEDGQVSPMTVVVIIYNLPDRDCAAFASNGQLYEVGKPGVDHDMLDGINRYREEYLGPILDAFTAKPEFANLRIVAMLEPDSYPNMTTNTILNPDGPALQWPALTSADGETYCDMLLSKYSAPGLESGLGVYGHGLQIAIEELAKIDNTYTYLDIAHAGWLGWDGNLERGVEGFIKLIDGANTDGISGFSKVRGFASNTSGYTPVEEPAISNADGDKMNLSDFYEWNSAVDEFTYIDRFNDAVRAAQPGFNPGFIIDTARNGWGRDGRPTPGDATRGTDLSEKVDNRAHRGHWCNVADAGVGESPKANPDSSRSHLDAFFWMKPPGESDGISFDVAQYPEGSAAYNNLDPVDKAVVDSASNPIYDGKALDTMCIPGEIRDGDKATTPMPFLSPHAGGWFHKQFIELIDNAYPPLGQSDY